MSLGAWFVEDLCNAVKGNENYRAIALGMGQVSSPEGTSEDQTLFYLLKAVDKHKNETKFLFVLDDGDACSLVGVSEGINKHEAEDVLLTVIDGNAHEVELAI